MLTSKSFILLARKSSPTSHVSTEAVEYLDKEEIAYFNVVYPSTADLEGTRLQTWYEVL
jgi:hypothetical protein